MDGTESSTPAVDSSGSASPETGASPASTGVTAPAATEAIPAQPAATPEVVQAAPPVVDQPLEATLQWPSDQELRYLPNSMRQRFGHLKEGYDKLESDHRTLKAEYEPLKGLRDKYGDPAGWASDVEAMRGLRNFKFGEDGQLVFDEQTGQPVYDVRPTLEAIAKQDPMIAAYLFDELLEFQDPHSGDSLARAFFKALGLDPDRIQDYRGYDPSKIASSNTGADPQARADVVAKHGEAMGPVFDSMHPDMQAEFPYLQESAQRILLDQQKAVLDDQQFKDEVRKYQEEQHRQAMGAWSSHVQAEEDNFLGGLRDSVFDSVLGNLADQFSLSADPTINSMHTQMLRVTFSALLDPSPGSRAAVAPMLQAAGVNLDFGALDRAVTQAKQLGGQYARLANLAKQPGYKGAPPNPQAVEDIRAKAEGAARDVGAHLSQVALRIAQSLGASVKQQAAVVDQKIQAARESRQIVTGQGPTAPTGAPVKQGAPFSRERWAGYGINR